MATANQTPTDSARRSQTFPVRLPRAEAMKRKHCVMKFTGTSAIDFTTCGQVKLARENNFREFKSANDMELMPKSGAGSEFGREQREIARRKKFGMRTRKYNVTDQPWLLKIGFNPNVKRFKGVRQGGVTSILDFCIFTQCADGGFEAYPVDDWYSLTPLARYKYLNSEEAEEAFERRDKTLNYFSVMKRFNTNNDADLDGEEPVKGKNKKKNASQGNSLIISEFDEELGGGFSDVDDDKSEDDEDDDEPKAKKKKVPTATLR